MLARSRAPLVGETIEISSHFACVLVAKLKMDVESLTDDGLETQRHLRKVLSWRRRLPRELESSHVRHVAIGKRKHAGE